MADRTVTSQPVLSTPPTSAPPAPGMSIAAFNGLMGHFLSELDQILGKREPQVTEVYKAFQIMANHNDPQQRRRPMELFMTKIMPYSEMVQERQDIFITEKCKEIPFLQRMNLGKYWIEEFGDQEKEGMWDFLNRLLFFGSTVMSLPEPLMDWVENFIGNGGLNQPGMAQLLKNPAAIMKMFNGQTMPPLSERK